MDKTTIAIVGKPSCGKSSIARGINKLYKLSIISTGDILRKKAETNKKLSIIHTGKLVGDAYVINLVEKEKAKEEYKDGYVMDGFPRTLKQAKTLDDVGLVVEIKRSDDNVRKLVAGRYRNKFTKKGWHETDTGFKFLKALNMLEKRNDDESETFESRLDIYNKKSPAILEFFKEQGKLLVVETGPIWDKQAILEVINAELIKRGLVKKKVQLCESFLKGLIRKISKGKGKELS